MERIKNNWELIGYMLVISILTIVMIWAINRKEGFHEDEMFSYGASNSTLGKTFLSYGRSDNRDTIMKAKNPLITIKNYVYYSVINQKAYEKAVKDLKRDDFKSVWRSREDAIEYLQIDNWEEAIDFATVYWNTATDVHPPLFYFAVHIMSILFWGHFSKYIIFLINLIFFYGTIYWLRKILLLIHKKHLTIPNLILYGASIGAISTVMFQRMYMMLTFFTVWLLYIHLEIYENQLQLNKNLKRKLIVVTILGFLTQYHFCFYAAFLTIIMIGLALMQKKKSFIKEYVLQYVKAAIVGILLFLPSIYHIFFSYRGVGKDARTFTMLESLKAFCKNIFGAFSISTQIGVCLSVVILVLFVWKFIQSNSKTRYAILVFPAILTFLMMIVMSPYKSLRYVMFLLPNISLILVILLDELFQNAKISCGLLTVLAIGLSVYGIITQPIKYLYIGYQEYLDIAQKYQEDRFVLVMPTAFSQNQDILEFQTYKETLIISPEQLEDLKSLTEFQLENEFVLAVKNWIDTPAEEVLDQVMKYTGYHHYELLYTSDKAAKTTLYRLYQ